MAAMPLLRVTGLAAGYGAIAAIKGISLDVEQGEIVTLIGSNGAGKSTTLRALSGVIKPRAGQVIFRDKPIERLAPHKIVRLGISHVPEGRGIFHRMTVQENLLLGAYQRDDDLSGDLDRVYSLFPRLKERRGQPGGTLSGGEQQMLAIGRALMARPTLLLLDEPSMGLSPLLVETIFATIVQIRQQGATVLLVEQNALMALEIADRAYVLESGAITLQGTGAELATNDAVRRSYLGED
jgi:branched-chain amino acid transport system ATP-binding protein